MLCDVLVAERARQDLVGCPDDRPGDGRVEPPERQVRLRRRLLDQDRGGH
jgi:hypothetical protein